MSLAGKPLLQLSSLRHKPRSLSSSHLTLAPSAGEGWHFPNFSYRSQLPQLCHMSRLLCAALANHDTACISLHFVNSQLLQSVPTTLFTESMCYHVPITLFTESMCYMYLLRCLQIRELQILQILPSRDSWHPDAQWGQFVGGEPFHKLPGGLELSVW